MAKDPVIKSVIREVVKEEVVGAFADFELKVQRMFESFAASMKNELTDIKDEIMGELKTVREEQVILNGRSAKINKLGDDVEKLKEIHPKYSHAQI